MSKTTDFTVFRERAHLELCLGLVEDAYSDIQQGNLDLVELQLREILETFDRLNDNLSEDFVEDFPASLDGDKIIQFPVRS